MAIHFGDGRAPSLMGDDAMSACRSLVLTHTITRWTIRISLSLLLTDQACDVMDGEWGDGDELV